MDSENKLLETMRDIKRIFQLYQDQNSSNSPTLDEDRHMFKRVINNLTEHAIQAQVKIYEENFLKFPPKKCSNCGKIKKAGRQVVIAMDAARRFAYFGKHPQQPSSSVAIVPKFQSGQETVDALERPSKWQDIRYAQERLSPRIMQKNETQQRISSPKKKKVAPSPQRYNNSFNDTHKCVLSPTLMKFDQEVVSTFSDSSSCFESRSRSRSISPARSATSSTGSVSPSRYQRTSSWESTYSTYSASSSGSVAPNTSYNDNQREPRSQGRKLDHPRRCRSISRSRSPPEDYSWHRRSRDSNVHSSNHSTDKDEIVHSHHRPISNPVSNGKLHRKSNDQMVRKNKRRTTYVTIRNLFGGVLGNFRGSNKSKPSTADKRRLERAVTGKRNVVVKYPKSKGYKNNSREKKLLQVHRKYYLKNEITSFNHLSLRNEITSLECSGLCS
ncbi:hypothetical protein MKW92_004032 [Papaver armeniacum]|nr:hypothetical protein MKW92_004032 [Papaver armeniacum]